MPQGGPIMPVALRAPVFEKFEQSPGGEALAAWRRHAVTMDVAPGTPVIAIVIDDMGLDLNRSMRAVALKGPLTLRICPMRATSWHRPPRRTPPGTNYWCISRWSRWATKTPAPAR